MGDVLTEMTVRKRFPAGTVAHLESFILQDLLNGYNISTLTQLGLIDYAKATITNHSDVSVGHLLGSIRSLARRCYYRCYFTAIFTYSCMYPLIYLLDRAGHTRTHASTSPHTLAKP